jgi:tetratricopeptide (TPR) repeat protein
LVKTVRPLLAVLAVAACSGEPAPTAALEVPAPADWSVIALEARPAIDQAIAECRRRPNDAAAFAALGRLYHGNHALSLASAAYEGALRLDPSDVRTRYFYGLIKEETGDADEALAAFERARIQAPGYAPIRYHIGSILLESARAAEAVDAFREAVRLSPADPGFRVGLARALRQTGAMKGALDAVEEALRLDEDDLSGHQVAALILKELGQSEAASRHAARARVRSTDVVRDPWFREVQKLGASVDGALVQAELFIDSGKPESAAKVLEAAAKTRPDRADVQVKLAAALALSGQLPRARDAYARAVALDPADAVARSQLSSTLLDLGDLDGAAREAAGALALLPELTHARVVAASVKLRKGDPRAALADLDPLVAEHPVSLLAHVTRGDALLALRRAPEAVAAYGAALRIRPGLPYAVSRLAEAQALAARPESR